MLFIKHTIQDEITITNKSIHVKYGFDKMYVYKKIPYYIGSPLLYIELLDLPTDPQTPETLMIDGYSELIYIDGVEIMNLNIEQEKGYLVRETINDIIGYDIFKAVETQYSDFIAANISGCINC